MNKPDRITNYVDTVCGQIRWKKARTVVGDELETHILDQRDAFMRGGKDEDTATTDAIAEMGDAVTVGTMLDRSYRPHLDWKILGCMLAIVLCSCLLSALLWRSGYYYTDMIAPYFGMVGFYVALALPFCLIDFTCYAKIPRILFFALAACLALSGAGVMIFWRTEALAMAFLPFASLLMLFHMRGGGYRKFLRCCLLFVVLPCVGCFIFLYFRYYGYAYDSWRIWAVTENFIVFVLSSVAMMTICVCCGFFGVNRRKALLTLIIPTAVFMTLFLVYSNLVQQYDSTQGYSPMDSAREMLQNTVWLGRGNEVADSFTENDVTRLIYRVGWLPFFAMLAAVAGFYAYLLKQCIRQRSMLGRSLSLMGWAALLIPTALGVLNAVGLMPNAFDVIPFFSTDTSLYACIVLGLMCNIFRNGEIVRDYRIKAVA